MKTTISIVAACIVAEFNIHAQNLILNGSFESPLVVSNTISAVAPTSWSTNGDYEELINGDYSPGYPLAKDGSQYAALGNSSSLAQAFTISSQGPYLLTWFDSTEYNGPGQLSPYSVVVSDSASNTVATQSFDANASGWRVWALRSISLMLAPGTYTLRFDGQTQVFAEESLLDSISLVQDNRDLLVNIHVSAVDVCWAGLTNQMYKVQFKTSLSSTNWVDLTPAMVGTGTNCVTDGVTGNDQRYYRVVRVP